jgi:hypothetical protein
MTHYISITGLRLKSPLHAPRFWFHAVRSMAQAQRAAGNILADARTVDGVHHTRSVWQSREAMLAYLKSGAHVKAMGVFPKIATGRTYGFDSEQIADWDHCLDQWRRFGREFG